MAKKLTETEKLMNRRTKSYADYTKKIFDSIDNVIIGIRKFAHANGMYDAHEETMEFVALMDEELSGFTFLTGFIKPNMGTTVTSVYGEKTKIDSEETQNNMSKMLRIGLPTEIVCSNDETQAMEFLTNWAAEQEEAEAQAVADSMSSGDLSDEDRKNKEVLDKILDQAVNKTGHLN